MKQIWVISTLTFKEAVRRRIVLASGLLGLGFVVIFSIGFHFIVADFMRTQQFNPNSEFYTQQLFNFMHLAAMYATNFLSIATAALITADTLAGEISSGTIQTILAKPVRRYQIVVGKWLGNAGLLAGYVVLLAGGCTLSIYLQSGYSAPNLLIGLVILYLNSILIMSVTLGLSSRISSLASGGVIFGLFGLAFIGGWVERFGNVLNNQTAINVGILSSLLMPCEAMWNMASQKMTSTLLNTFGANPFSFGSSPSVWMVLYTLIYMLGFCLYAVRVFTRRDL
jgi:Cu-processing system permease protein